MKLQNQDIWLAYPRLIELSKVTFPPEVSLGLAKLVKEMQVPYALIEHERKILVNRYGVEDEKTGQVSVEYSSPNAGDFAVAFGELLTKCWEEDIPVEKVRLPSKIEAICLGCGHKMETVFLIDAQVLMPLGEYFVEIAEGG